MKITLTSAPSNTQALPSNQSSVRSIASAIVSDGRQPSARIREQSRWISGESPGQPRRPPVCSSSGSRPMCRVISATDSSTTMVSSVPMLSTVELSTGAVSIARTIPSTQSRT